MCLCIFGMVFPTLYGVNTYVLTKTGIQLYLLYVYSHIYRRLNNICSKCLNISNYYHFREYFSLICTVHYGNFIT